MKIFVLIPPSDSPLTHIQSQMENCLHGQSTAILHEDGPHLPLIWLAMDEHTPILNA